jgi:UDP-galactopyranose mutase
MPTVFELPDLFVFSHLRWDFVFQRPQHLLSRYVESRRVYYFEEPIFGFSKTPQAVLRRTEEGVKVVVPYLPDGLSPQAQADILRKLLDDVMVEERIRDYALWYYTPMALSFTKHLKPKSIIFDCMDELSAFKFAPPELIEMESELLNKADIVFTGGHSLFEAKKHRHSNIHPFPSSIDYNHFAKARGAVTEPADQAKIPHPRLGFFGVIDERMNIELLEGLAKARPEWQIVMIGPVVKIDPATLPKLPNIHYLGKKDYKELPAYLAGWDCALMPFALNESTRFISPTKTPEYLAAGRPVVSTSIRDVVKPYGHEKLVHIADTAEEFVSACEKAMHEAKHDAEWKVRVDEFLALNSWDITWRNMVSLERAVYRKQPARPAVSAEQPVVASVGI